MKNNNKFKIDNEREYKDLTSGKNPVSEKERPKQQKAQTAPYYSSNIDESKDDEGSYSFAENRIKGIYWNQNGSVTYHFDDDAVTINGDKKAKKAARPFLWKRILIATGAIVIALVSIVQLL